MQNFNYNLWMRRGFFLFISFCGINTYAMNSTIISRDVPLKPEATIAIFNPKQELERGRQWSKVVPGEVVITPDGKGVVISESGKVRRSLFDGMHGCETIIEHPKVKHSPMITMAQKNDGSLLVVSAGNYINQEKKRVAEYILFCNGLSKLKKLDWPIQAISLDSCGKNLAIAGQRSVDVVDLETDKNTTSFFKYNGNPENWIVDIAINPEGRAVIAVGSKGGVQWMYLSKNNDVIKLSNLKYAVSNDDIKKIYYPSYKELLYVTYDGNVKIIDMNDLLEPSGEEIRQTTVFAHSTVYDMVVADPSEHVSTAHWTNNTKVAARYKIKVYRKSSECTERFILELPELEERYSYITELGQYGSGIGHLLHVALRDKYVVALATDGKMRVWSLPEKNTICSEVDKKEQGFLEKLAELEFASRAKEAASVNVTPRKKRAYSESKNSKNMLRTSSVETAEHGDKLKKISPRMRLFFKSSTGHNSKETTPTSSRDNSPSRSPHKGEVVTLSEVEKKDDSYGIDDLDEVKIKIDYRETI